MTKLLTTEEDSFIEVAKGEFVSRDFEYLMTGDYSTFDQWDKWDEDAFGILPPIGYKDGVL